MLTKITKKELFFDIFFDVIGSILFAAGIYSFAANANFAPGGVSGLAIIFNYKLPMIPIGIATLLINIPIILYSFPVLGRKFFLKSLKTILINTFFLDVVFPHVPVYNGEPLLAALFTGVFVGSGCALIYMRGSSTGGTDFLVLAMKKKFPHVSIGSFVLITNFIVVVCGGIVFKNMDALLYGLIESFCDAMIMDRLMYGVGAGKMVIIISKKHCGNKIAEEIALHTDRGSTLINATGTYSKECKDIIMCACSNKQFYPIRDAAYRIDPSAIVIITEANEVFGEGFKKPELKK
ncbi:MAG: hypothetical protein BKP49_08205 [Treponema sp. CETP13]|nr:MAG: hypothetical protein BKP49_08205 [Treponema sp. CETP13]